MFSFNKICIKFYINLTIIYIEFYKNTFHANNIGNNSVLLTDKLTRWLPNGPGMRHADAPTGP
jgi:hypothetical protein